MITGEGVRLSTEYVQDLGCRCMFAEEDLIDGNPPPDRLIEVDGIVIRFGFDRTRIEANKDEIRAALAELPDSFREGMSFLNACNDRHGNQWTGFHQTMALLFSLGIAAGMVKFCFPREMWGVLPGGMPYYIVEI